MPLSRKSGSKIVKLENIDVENSPQIRVQTDCNTVDEYAEAMANGDEFPPVDIYPDEVSQKYKVLHGIHRIEAAKKISSPDIKAYVHRNLSDADILRETLQSNS